MTRQLSVFHLLIDLSMLETEHCASVYDTLSVSGQKLTKVGK